MSGDRPFPETVSAVFGGAALTWLQRQVHLGVIVGGARRLWMETFSSVMDRRSEDACQAWLRLVHRAPSRVRYGF